MLTVEVLRDDGFLGIGKNCHWIGYGSLGRPIRYTEAKALKKRIEDAMERAGIEKIREIVEEERNRK